MALTDQLFDGVSDIWQRYYRHPFLVELANGSLPVEKFRYYMAQDYLYLLDYAKVFALGIVKAQDEETMRQFAGMVYQTLHGEMAIHKAYMKRLSISEAEIANTKPALCNMSYTSYMLWIGNSQGVLEVLAAVLACSWSYQKIGERLAAAPGAAEHPLYGEWISGYASKKYQAGNDALLDLVNRMGSGAGKEQTGNLLEIFRNCSLYEELFWDMAYAGKE